MSTKSAVQYTAPRKASFVHELSSLFFSHGMVGVEKSTAKISVTKNTVLTPDC